MIKVHRAVMLALALGALSTIASCGSSVDEEPSEAGEIDAETSAALRVVSNSLPPCIAHIYRPTSADNPCMEARRQIDALSQSARNEGREGEQGRQQIYRRAMYPCTLFSQSFNTSLGNNPQYGNRNLLFRCESRLRAALGVQADASSTPATSSFDGPSGLTAEQEARYERSNPEVRRYVDEQMRRYDDFCSRNPC